MVVRNLTILRYKWKVDCCCKVFTKLSFVLLPIDCCLPSSSHLGPAGKNSGLSLHQSTATSLSSWNLNKNRKTERRLAQGNRKAFPFISLTMPVMTNINATDLGPTKELTRSVSLLQPGLLC